MPKLASIGAVAMTFGCALAACLGPSVALANEGTTVRPAGAAFNVAISAGTSARLTTPIATISCAESTSRGAVPTTPDNANTEEDGAVGLTFEAPTFTRCTAPGASSVTVTAATGWSATAAGFLGDPNDMLAVAIPEEALRISITNTHGSCTIVAPASTVSAIGEWTDGTGSGASTAALGGELDYTSSGTCIGHCTQLAASEEGGISLSMPYSITNATERAEAITF